MNMVDDVKKRSYQKIRGLKYNVKKSTFETLCNIEFGDFRGQYVDQRKMAEFNLDLDNRSCLGRVAQSAAVIEKHFPDINLHIGEVRKDWFAEKMLEMLALDPKRAYDSSFMSELLMYEEPHMVLMMDDVQFEPLSIQFGQYVQHPEVATFPVWEAIASSVLVSKAWLEQDPVLKMQILKQSEELCFGTTLVAENMCELLEFFGRKEELVSKVEWCAKNHTCARNLYCYYLLTGDRSVYDMLVYLYTEKVFEYLC